MRAFFTRLCGSFELPSAELLGSRILTDAYTTILIEIDNIIRGLTDVTLTLDGWEDVNGKSVYGFMALKNEVEQILDIIDMSDRRPSALILKNTIMELLS